MSLLSTTLPKVRRKPPVLVVVGVATLALTATAVIAGPSQADAAQASDAKVPPTITVGSNPIDVAISPQKSEAYVVNDGSVSVINLKTRKQVAEVGTGFTDQVTIGLTNSGNRAYIGTFDENVLKVFNTNTRKVMDEVRVGRGVAGITRANTAKGQFAYAGLITAERVAVIDTSTREVVKRIRTPQGVQAIQVTPNSNQVWAASSYDGHLWMIDTATQKIVKRINLEDSGPAVSIAFGAGGNRAWVLGLGGVSVVSVKTGELLAFVPLPRLFPREENLNPGSIALPPGGKVALIVNSTYPDSPAQGAVAVLGIKKLKVRRHIDLGTEPQGMAIDARRDTTYVTNYGDDTLSYFSTPGQG